MNEATMARPAQKLNVKKSSVGGSKLDQPIKGILTSRIETRDKDNQSYYYGFFKLENQVGEFPVVFKTKPTLTKGNQVELIGKWANNNQARPSFTAIAYQITSDPPIVKKRGPQVPCRYSGATDCKICRQAQPEREARKEVSRG